jgi:hypothetical protein
VLYILVSIMAVLVPFFRFPGNVLGFGYRSGPLVSTVHLLTFDRSYRLISIGFDGFVCSGPVG